MSNNCSKPKIIILAISGRIGSGKTTVAAACAGPKGERFIIPVAQSVYESANNVFKSLNIEPYKCRNLLTTLGDIGRQADVDFWIKKVHQKIQSIVTGSTNSVEIFYVPDIRYPNEIKYLREHYRVIHVKLNGSYRPEVVLNDSEDHLNEMTYDVEFNPNTPLDEICSCVMNFIEIESLM